jgi:hypothetical protein
VYQDVSYDSEKGYFTVERQEDGAYFGNLSGYYGDLDVRSDAVDREFWSRAAAFCRGEVEKLNDQICVTHWVANAPDPFANPGRCKMANFRCKSSA